MNKAQQSNNSACQIVKCGMCLRKFTVSMPHTGRMPQYCAECSIRRRAEQSRGSMARMRDRRQHLAEAG